jgi:L-arabinose isomerase
MKGIKAGLLPLYLKLYDDITPERHDECRKFYGKIAAELERLGVTVETVPLCRVREEFIQGVNHFNESGVSCIITLHLAYSPSLESAEILARSDLPVIILDTTPDFSFGPGQDRSRIMHNHGIHGVQDLCNLLLRMNKPFLIEAGHFSRSDVLSRVVSRLPAVRMARDMKQAKVGCIGTPFPGMGDFAVPFPELKQRIGINVLQLKQDEFKYYLGQIDKNSVDREMDEDRMKFDVQDVPEVVHIRSVKTGLALRSWIQENELTGFTFNFMDITEEAGFPTVPFLEAGKAMSRGTGYAGEGDVLTAALAGSVLSVFPETSFTEMFCPDWEGGRIFLSHMGEINVNLLPEGSRIKEMEYIFSTAGNPAFVPGRFKEGEGVLINCAPGADGLFRLILSPVSVDGTGDDPGLRDSVRGWIKPRGSLENFLEQYSRLGGTHHLLLTYGGDLEHLRTFGKLMGWNVDIIE